MAIGLTRAQLRDSIRRHLQIIPPLDAGIAGASAGDSPQSQPDPSNAVLNEYLNMGIDAVNRVCRVGPVQTLTAAVPVSTHLRKQYIDISGSVGITLAADEVLDVWFTENSTSNAYALEPYLYYKDAKKFQQFAQAPPGRPAQYQVSGSQIILIPPSDRAGTLSFDTAQGMDQLTTDSQQIPFLPVEFQVAVEYWAVLLACARNGQDVESQARMQAFAPIAMQLLTQIYQWKNGYQSGGIDIVRETMMMIPNAMQPVTPAPQGQQGQ